MRALTRAASAAAGQLDNGDYQGARTELSSVLTKLKLLRLRSAWAEWALAASLDMAGDTVAAFRQIQKALELDPVNSAHHKSYGIITDKLKQGLMSAPDHDASIASTYALLRDAGECDVFCHLAWARHLLHGKRLAEAEAVLDAVTLTAPASIDAWRLRARLARMQGDEAGAATYLAEAESRNAEPVAFAIPPRGPQS
jgi:Tfp pilus assembly protein PilF